MRELRSILALAFVLLAGAGCQGETSAGEAEFRVVVGVHEVETGTVEDQVVTTGTLRSPRGATLEVETRGVLSIARVGGRRLAEGDRVRAGQVIAEVAGEDTRLAARMEANQQRYDNAQRVLESRQRLYEEGLISEEELRNAETSLAEAKLEWERSQLTTNRTRLTSPIGGVILTLARGSDGLPTADGQLVNPGFVVAKIAPLDELIADVDLVGPDLARVEIGQSARVRHYAWEDEEFAGRLVRLAPALDPTTRTVRGEVTVGNGDGRLRPGMFVEVTLIAERREEVPVVPREAVTERDGAKVVFVLSGQQRVSQRAVILGLGDDDIVEVRQGIEIGERVVDRGLETLRDQTRVRVSGS